MSASELHEFLEVKSKYADWFKNMSAYGFEENIDYRAFSKNLENGGRRIDYEITLDMAKEIAMIQRNEKGKQARQYFIKIEKQWNRPKQIIARGLIESQKLIENLNQQVIEMKPKAEYFDNLVDRTLLTNFRGTAKELHIAPNKFINCLLEDGYNLL